MENNIESKLKQINIGLGFDSNYIVPIYALITSIFFNNRSNNITFHVIATGVNELEKSKLINFIKSNNSKIFFYEISEDLVRKSVVIPEDSHFTIATYYRLFFPSLLDKEIKRLLYIDSDTIVTGDLMELYEINIGGCPIAAAPDSVPGIREDLGIKEKGKYFNAGVLLIDTKNWREQQVTENVFKFLLLHPEKAKWVDQDALNATLIGKWYRIDNKYNFTLSDVILQVPSKELITDKIIIHYTSSNKPWHFLTRNKLRYLYHYYLKMSPKSGEKKYTDFNWNIKSIWTFFRIRIKEFYFDHKIDRILPIKNWIDSSEPYY